MTLSSDPSLLDHEKVIDFVQASYWSQNRSREEIRRQIDASIVLGLYYGETQAGFARVKISLGAGGIQFGWIADVIIWPEYRGRGLALLLMTTLLHLPKLRHVSHFGLSTVLSHGLYERFGFRRAGADSMLMGMQRPVKHTSNTT